MKAGLVGVIGAGRSGIAAARLLKKQGYRVLLSDQNRISSLTPRGIDLEEGGHTDRLLRARFLIRSPGVPSNLPILKAAHRQKIPLWGELEYASRFAHAKRRIAITGTNGKTTTTALVGALFKTAGPTVVAGNIGRPLSEALSEVRPRSTLVLEVSSYQLEDIDRFHPTLSAILNVTPDHLEHHGSLAAYAAAKARIFENQTGKDVCVLNADDPWCRRFARRCSARVFFFSRTHRLAQGIWFEPAAEAPGFVFVHWEKQNLRFPLRFGLPGPHNIENALAAIALGLAGGLRPERVRRVLARFKGVEHRLETVRVLRGVTYVNDSKATNVDSTRVALESFQQPLWVIMGGRGKGSPYTSLAALLKARARGLLLIGEDAGRIESELGGEIACLPCGTLAAAVAQAHALAKKGEVVLLSPACASFDQYGSYEERGADFKSHVRRLA